VLVLDKAEHDQSYWPRLLKNRVKLGYLKTDFSRWKDEDEEDDDTNEAANSLGGMDFSSLLGGGPERVRMRVKKSEWFQSLKRWIVGLLMDIWL
jgi:hypothetical protein